MLYSKILNLFRFQLHIGNSVYEVSCPSSSIPNLVGADGDGDKFVFGFAHEDKKTVVSVMTSWTLVAESANKPEYPLALLRAAKGAVQRGEAEIGLSTGNYAALATDKLVGLRDAEVRTLVISYILGRYDLEFETPFSVVEVVVALESSVSRIVRVMKFCHKHQMVSFSWAPEIWQEKAETTHWLVEDFGVTKSNYDELRRSARNPMIATNNRGGSDEETEWDLFICHASEDKESLVLPLAQTLKDRGVRVWLDEWTLQLGDSLSRRIDHGLAHSRFGAVVLSPDFFKKEWPQRELSGLVQKEISVGKVILPIWHNVDREFIATKSPTLADKLAANSKAGIPSLADQIQEVLDNGRETPADSPEGAATSNWAVVEISFKNLQTGHFDHLYSLVVTLKLLLPPDQGRLKLRLEWPGEVPIHRMEGLRASGRNIEEGSVQSRSFTVDWAERTFPDETVELVGPNSPNRLEYKYNDRVWRLTEKGGIILRHRVFFEDHASISGEVSFKELNVY